MIWHASGDRINKPVLLVSQTKHEEKQTNAEFRLSEQRKHIFPSLSPKPVRPIDHSRIHIGRRGGGHNSVSSCELKLHLHAEQLHPLQMSRGLARPRASTSITVSSTGQTLVDNCQKESRDAGGSVPCSHSCCTKSAERGHKMACALCLNISHLQSNLMNYSDVAIYCASHLKHLPCQPVC